MEVENCDPSRKIFHAGTQLLENQLVTNGGRVLCVCAMAGSIKEAKLKAYEYVETVTWKSEYHRSDIGFKAF